MTAPLDLDGLEKLARAYLSDNPNMGIQAQATVLALIARVRKLEESREHWRILEMGASGRVCELEEENDSIREKLKIADEALNDIAAWDFLPNASQWISMTKARKAITAIRRQG